MSWFRRFRSMVAIRLLARVLALGMTAAILYAFVLLERGVLALLPPAAAQYYRESSWLGPAIGIPLVLLVLVGLALAADRVEKWIARR